MAELNDSLLQFDNVLFDVNDNPSNKENRSFTDTNKPQNDTSSKAEIISQYDVITTKTLNTSATSSNHSEMPEITNELSSNSVDILSPSVDKDTSAKLIAFDELVPSSKTLCNHTVPSEFSNEMHANPLDVLTQNACEDNVSNENLDALSHHVCEDRDSNENLTILSQNVCKDTDSQKLNVLSPNISEGNVSSQNLDSHNVCEDIVSNVNLDMHPQHICEDIIDNQNLNTLSPNVCDDDTSNRNMDILSPNTCEDNANSRNSDSHNVDKDIGSNQNLDISSQNILEDNTNNQSLNIPSQKVSEVNANKEDSHNACEDIIGNRSSVSHNVYEANIGDKSQDFQKACENNSGNLSSDSHNLYKGNASNQNLKSQNACENNTGILNLDYHNVYESDSGNQNPDLQYACEDNTSNPNTDSGIHDFEQAIVGEKNAFDFVDFNLSNNSGIMMSDFKNEENDIQFKDEEFHDAVQFFKDPSSFTCLENAGSSSASSNPLLSRSSLYVNFDPLHAKFFSQSTKHNDLQGIAEDDGNHEISSDVSENVPKVVNKHLTNISPRESLGNVLISFDSPIASKDSHAQFSENEKPKKIEPQKLYTEEELQQALKIQELSVQDTFLKNQHDHEIARSQKQRELEAKIQELNHLCHTLHSILKEVTDVAIVLFDREKDSQEKLEIAEKENEKLKEDLKTSVEDLQSVESMFADFHKRYEQCKNMLKLYTQNENNMKQQLENMKMQLLEKDEMYKALQSRTEEMLDKANTEVANIKKAGDAQVAVLKAQLKKAELKISSLESDVKHIKIENDKLSCICDELMAKVSEA